MTPPCSIFFHQVMRILLWNIASNSPLPPEHFFLSDRHEYFRKFKALQPTVRVVSDVVQDCILGLIPGYLCHGRGAGRLPEVSSLLDRTREHQTSLLSLFLQVSIGPQSVASLTVDVLGVYGFPKSDAATQTQHFEVVIDKIGLASSSRTSISDICAWRGS